MTSRNPGPVPPDMRGVSLVELLVAIAVVAILAAGIFLFVSQVYQQRQEFRILTDRTIDAALMKQALDKTVASAGGLEISSSTNSVQIGTFLVAASTLSVPAAAITAITASGVSFSWTADSQGIPTVCTGFLNIAGSTLEYTVSGIAACTPTGQSSAETTFPVGPGWSFIPALVTGASCMGPAFSQSSLNQEAIIATQSPINGTATTSATASTEVTVCLPN